MTNRTKYALWGMFAAALLVILIGPWVIGAEWSLIDDPGHAAALRALSQDQGALRASLDYAWQQASGDTAWGLFRPTYYVYAATVYHLPPAVVMSLRWLMIFVAVVGPGVYVWRRTSRLSIATIAVLLTATSSSLYLGAIYLSLQELTGIALIGAGLWVSHGWLRLVFWSAAALVKAPFAWLLLAWGGVEVGISRRYARGGIALAVGLLVIGLNAIFSRSGAYTQGYAFDFVYLLNSLVSLTGFPMALLFVSFIWWAATSRSRLQWNPYAAVFIAGAAMYAATLLPWRAFYYYTAPVFYLLAVGLALLLGAPAIASRRRVLLGLSVPLVIAVFVAGQAIWEVGKQLRTTVGIRDCLEATGPMPPTYIAGPALTTSESAGRMEQILELRSPASDFTVVWIGESWDSLPPVDEVLLLRNKVNSPPIQDPAALLICDLPNADVYRLNRTSAPR